MASDSSVITLRISAEDHDRLRAVANYNDVSLSEFVRRSALMAAHQVIADHGIQAVLEADRSTESARATAAQRRLVERLERLERSHSEVDRPAPDDRA